MDVVPGGRWYTLLSVVPALTPPCPPITLAQISKSMLGKVTYNLNAMSHDTAIAMIRRVLALGVNLTELYVDTVGREEVYQEMLEKLFPQIKIVVTSKADDKFPICSAASICAKVSRDRILENWGFAEKAAGRIKPKRIAGSGYPGDPETKEWLEGAFDPTFGFPEVVRFSWAPASARSSTSRSQSKPSAGSAR